MESLGWSFGSLGVLLGRSWDTPGPPKKPRTDYRHPKMPPLGTQSCAERPPKAISAGFYPLRGLILTPRRSPRGPYRALESRNLSRRNSSAATSFTPQTPYAPNLARRHGRSPLNLALSSLLFIYVLRLLLLVVIEYSLFSIYHVSF